MMNKTLLSLETVIIIFCTLCTESIILIRHTSSSTVFQVMKNNQSHAALRGSFFHEAINHTTFILVAL